MKLMAAKKMKQQLIFRKINLSGDLMSQNWIKVKFTEVINKRGNWLEVAKLQEITGKLGLSFLEWNRAKFPKQQNQ